MVSSDIPESSFIEAGTYHDLDGEPLSISWDDFLPADFDTEFDFTNFDEEFFAENWDSLENYDYTYNIQSLFMSVNTF